jgi:hypothetical protein
MSSEDKGKKTKEDTLNVLDKFPEDIYIGLHTYSKANPLKKVNDRRGN